MIARAMHWTYDDVQGLSVEVFDILVTMLNREADAAREHR